MLTKVYEFVGCRLSFIEAIGVGLQFPELKDRFDEFLAAYELRYADIRRWILKDQAEECKQRQGRDPPVSSWNLIDDEPQAPEEATNDETQVQQPSDPSPPIAPDTDAVGPGNVSSTVPVQSNSGEVSRPAVVVPNHSTDPASTNQGAETLDEPQPPWWQDEAGSGQQPLSEEAESRLEMLVERIKDELDGFEFQFQGHRAVRLKKIPYCLRDPHDGFFFVLGHCFVKLLIGAPTVNLISHSVNSFSELAESVSTTLARLNLPHTAAILVLPDTCNCCE